MCHHPEWHDKPTIAGIPHTPQGIKLLGGALADGIEQYLGPFGLSAEPAAGSKEKALSSLNKIRDMLATHTHT